jgi:hypothetical protein
MRNYPKYRYHRILFYPILLYHPVWKLSTTDFSQELQPYSREMSLNLVLSTPVNKSTMKFRSYVLVFLAAFAGSLFLASCLNEDNKIPPNCFDGCKNNGEEETDCGGPCEKKCDHCINGRWDPGIEFGETWIDCGGPDCPPCQTCSNGILDPNESGIDCGSNCGPCSSLCGDGLLNGHETQIDCVSDVAFAGECDLCPTCSDLTINGDEVGIDCGDPGAFCPPCVSSGDCTNGIIDGGELWTDCGGPSCYGCVDTLGYRNATNGPNIYAPPTFITAALSASQTLTISGVTTDGGTIEITIPKPSVGWDLIPANLSIPLGPAATAPAVNPVSIKYTSLANVVFNTNNPNGTGTIVIIKYASGVDNTGAAVDFFRFSINGSLKNSTGAQTYAVVNGLVMVTI